MSGLKKLAKSFLNVATFNMIKSNQAQKEALKQQQLSQQVALQQQQQASNEALLQQQRNQAVTEQANEQARRSTAEITTDRADRGNEANLTNGRANSVQTIKPSLGDASTLNDEEDWY